MSTFMRSKAGRRAAVVSGAALAAVASLPSASHASLVINLALANGATSLTLTSANAGQDIAVRVYATVTGLNTVTSQTTAAGATSTDINQQLLTGNFDGFQYAYYNVLSSIGSGGAAPGGIDTVTSGKSPALNGSLGFAASGSQVGAVGDLNGDGVADLGSSGASNPTAFAKPRAAAAVWNNFTSDTGNADAGGNELYSHTGSPAIIVSGASNNIVSFLVETLYFKVGSTIGNGLSTTFAPVPAPTIAGQSNANWFQDNTAITSPPQNTSNGAYTGGNSVTFITGGSATGTTGHSILLLGSTAPASNYGSQLTTGTATFSPALPVANSINVTGSNGNYTPGFAHVTATGGVATDYVQISGFNPSTDPESYALKLDVGGATLSPTDSRVATIIADINAGSATDGVTAAVVSGYYTNLFPGYDILLTATGTASIKYLGFDFSQETGIAGVTVTDVAAVPEPATIAGLGLAAAGLLVGRRKRTA